MADGSVKFKSEITTDNQNTRLQLKELRVKTSNCPTRENTIDHVGTGFSFNNFAELITMRNKVKSKEFLITFISQLKIAVMS